MPNPIAAVWDRTVLPVATDICTRFARKMRADVLREARGRVLEVGIGSGPSLDFYSGDVTEVVGVEPNETARRKLQQRARTGDYPFRVEGVDGDAGNLPFPDASFDTVSVQLVLCTVPHPEHALRELRRLVKPDGRLLFIEHVRHADKKVARLQDRLNPLWRRCAGGCRLNQDSRRLIEDAGFRLERLEEVRDRSWPRFLSDIIWGVAVPE